LENSKDISSDKDDSSTKRSDEIVKVRYESSMRAIFGGLISIFSGGLLVFIARLVYGDMTTLIAQIAGISLIVFGAGLSSMKYLRVEPKISSKVPKKENLKGIEEKLSELPSLKNLNEELKKLNEKINENKVPDIGLTENDRTDIIHTIKNRIDATITEDFIKAIEEKFMPMAFDISYLDEIKLRCEETKNRLRVEIESLSRRGNLNLVIGSITTLLAAGVLAYVVLNQKPTDQGLNSLLWHYVPRLSVVIFIEVFAFFFCMRSRDIPV
jgi:hypothetical protein